MINEENRRKLQEAVVLGRQHRGNACALERLRLTVSDFEGRLTELAKQFGFSEHEAHGIMDGWDGAMYGRTCFKYHYYPYLPDEPYQYEPLYPAYAPEYEAGRTLGQELATSEMKVWEQ